VQKNGGLLLGAFTPEPEGGGKLLVGFVFGFLGLSPDGRLKLCSHMAGVKPCYQNQNVGYRLKLAQREHVLARGTDLITWTFDPLESRNAYLNFHKLGAACSTYLQSVYGEMRDGLNIGVPSDRFQVDWHITSAHVAGRLGGDRNRLTLSTLRADGVSILNHPLPSTLSDPPHPPQTTLLPAGDRVLLQIPANFQAIKSTDMELARAWRMHTRALFEVAFANTIGTGYTVVDLLFEQGRSYYLLKKNWRPQGK
jgi:predicted GNAT superfamily acetyltransferase